VLDCTAKFAFEVPNVPAGNYGIVLVGWTSYGVGPPWVAYSGDVPEVLHVRALPDTATDAPGAWLERQAASVPAGPLLIGGFACAFVASFALLRRRIRLAPSR
jgi:hypothetical protein